MKVIRSIKMDTVIGCSTFVLAVLTFALLLVAIFNYSKFVKNVELMENSIREQARSVALQSQAINLQTQDIYLTHKPVVYLKRSFVAEGKDKDNPFNHIFLLANSGKLPARDTSVHISMDFIDENQNICTNFTQNFPLLQGASVYPETDIAVWIPEKIKTSSRILKAQALFSIEYSGEDGKKNKELMKFVFSQQTSFQWVYVGLEVDSFAKERAESERRKMELEKRLDERKPK